MTTELEKQFFDTFKISKRKICNYHNCKCPLFDTSNIKSACPKQKALQEIPTGYGTKNCSLIVEKYPQITDRHYLELICVLNKHNWENYQCCTFLIGQTIEKVKNEILLELIENLIGLESETTKYDKLKHQVQAIFEGE